MDNLKETNKHNNCNYTEIAAEWNDVHRYSPAPRHRRRLTIKMLTRLDFDNWLDIGCAQPFLIEGLLKRKSVNAYGCDISEKVISSNKKDFPKANFFVMDISKPLMHTGCYDLVTCLEVLEHIEDWQVAAKNISQLCGKWLFVTVPRGKIYPIDRRVGHIRHFKGEELLEVFKELGFTPLYVRKWGFPIHSLYKYFINTMFSDKMYNSFGNGCYGMKEKFLSEIIYILFFINDLFKHGSQLIVLLEKHKDNKDGCYDAWHE